MNECERQSDSPLIREELCHGFDISRKMMERPLSILDLYFEDMLAYIWKALNEIFDITCSDLYADGSHSPQHGGAKGAFTAAEEGGGTIQIQDQFITRV